MKNRLLTHPTSIILAQASIESGWGTSRFFLQGRNLFGVWSFNKNEQRIQTKGTRDGKHMYVKKYSTISESIEDYFKILARGGAYVRFRARRASTNNPYEIIKTLDKYCELREKYVVKLKNQISYNKFEKYDAYELDPQYLRNFHLMM
ncbi:MAG: glucosaminidase domain-containing protein [Candidatus Marinimicrobia bacterium]|nr:glucosaminidase domain-containing protein [Candidatus Neomarinimicrobiota bacterium]